MTEGKPLAVNLLRTLENMLKSYVETDHLDILVNEVIANGLDEFRKKSMTNGKIEIKFDRVSKDFGYIEFHLVKLNLKDFDLINLSPYGSSTIQSKNPQYLDEVYC